MIRNEQPAAAAAVPRVFSPTFVERLSMLTAAEREIRKMGYRIIWTRLAGGIPTLQLMRDPDVSMGKLMDAMTGKVFLPQDGGSCILVSGIFMGCYVGWHEEVYRAGQGGHVVGAVKVVQA